MNTMHTSQTDETIRQEHLPFVTLDKSYIRACNKNDLIRLSEKYRLVIPEAQAYEIIKDPPRKRASLFSKFPDCPSPYLVAISIPKVLRIEQSEHKPYTQDRAAPRDLSIHQSLADPHYNLTEELQKATDSVQSDIEQDMDIIRRIANSWKRDYSKLFSGSDKERAENMQSLERLICTDQFVKTKYADAISWPGCIHSHPVPSELLTHEWANFRWFQVYALYALDLAIRYPDLDVTLKLPGAIKKLNHDVLDSRGLLTALFVGGAFATQEEKLKKFWNILNPNGYIICHNKKL